MDFVLKTGFIAPVLQVKEDEGGGDVGNLSWEQICLTSICPRFFVRENLKEMRRNIFPKIVEIKK